jgi:hypothetical protein
MAVVYLQKGNGGANAIALLQLIASIYEKEKDRDQQSAGKEIGFLQDTGAEVSGDYLQKLESKAGYQEGTLSGISSKRTQTNVAENANPETGEPRQVTFKDMYRLPTKGKIQANYAREQLPLIGETKKAEAEAGYATQPVRSATKSAEQKAESETQLEIGKTTGKELAELQTKIEAARQKEVEVAKRQAQKENITPKEQAEIDKMRSEILENEASARLKDRLPQEHQNWLFTASNTWAENYRKRLKDYTTENRQMFYSKDSKGKESDRLYDKDSDELKSAKESITSAGYIPIETTVKKGTNLFGIDITDDKIMVRPGIPDDMQKQLNNVDKLNEGYAKSYATGPSSGPVTKKETAGSKIGKKHDPANKTITTVVKGKDGKPQNVIVKYDYIKTNASGQKEAYYRDEKGQMWAIPVND